MASPRACPRCGRSLAPVVYGGVAIEGCPGCQGILVSQGALVGLLDATSIDLLARFDPDAALAPSSDRGGQCDCPSCGARMEIDDYCASNLVLFDRCPSCQLLWLDPGKLGTMTLMWARMEARMARVRAESAVLEKDLASFVSAMIFAHGGRLPDRLP